MVTGKDIDKFNEETTKFREERLNKLISESQNWDPDADDIRSLVVILEELYGCACILNQREIDKKCDLMLVKSNLLLSIRNNQSNKNKIHF
jgi:hypothetical protein